ncbi:GNAT family N-acetyltransferase [Cohnella silvisoli]|uniref:GNAT family N-acetyltransferase n=1 Tax=Cohnella silvisoli TaxID=2873699 RepID=A0ABV1L4R5_9BACL|nr:GNAT family N-acetyltransferase [Cohnella silvisoli]MCD9026080.1 GNAT family N-acetyltransferase [Cohnella silvisoli]
MGIVSLNIKEQEAAEEVWALQHPAYRVEAALIGVADLPPLQDTVKSLQTCGETFWGYRDDDSGELVGAVSYEREREGERRYTICRLMVHPDFMRRGIGRLMMEHILSDTPNSAAWTVTAEIRNLPAIILYERFGFMRSETFEPIPGITMLRLERAPNRE